MFIVAVCSMASMIVNKINEPGRVKKNLRGSLAGWVFWSQLASLARGQLAESHPILAIAYHIRFCLEEEERACLRSNTVN